MSYRLGDLTVKNWNSWDRVPRMPETIAVYVGSALFGGGVLTATQMFIASALTYVGISAVTSWALSALMPMPDFSSFGSQGTLVNSRDATAPADFVYGEVRKGGTVTFYESTGEENKFLHQIIVLAGHEVAEIGDIYINDEIVTLDGSGYVTDDEWVIDGGANPSGIRILKHDGSQTSTADTFANSSTDSLNSTLLAESELTGSDALDSNFVGRGIAYLYVRYEYDTTVFASGVPLITAVVKGKKVYDPRTAVTAYSNNAALCMRDFITSEYGLNDSAVDDVVFSAAANESDELVTLSGSGTEKRYTINGIIKASSPIGDVLGKMSTACAGTLFWGSGYWKLKVGAYSSPVKTLTLDDLRGPINLNTRSSMRDSFNGVTGTFNDASAKFITADYPPIKSSTFQTEDGGDELLLDLPLPFTTSAATAQRIAKMTLYRGREQMTISADFGLEAFNIEVGDIIAFTNERYGFDEKEFEVIGWKFASNQDAGDLRVTLTLQETSAAAFDWNAEESDIIGNNTNLPVANAGLVINNLTASGGGRTQGDGTFINSVILDWDAVSSSFLDYYEIEWKALSDSVYASTTTTESGIELSPLVDGVEYIFRVRAVSVSGVSGEYATVTFTGGGDTTAPALPTNIVATGHFEYITLEWDNPTDADFNYVEVWENDQDNMSGGNFRKAGQSSGGSFSRTNANVSRTYYYFLRSVDYTGNKSAFTTDENWKNGFNSAQSTFLDDDDFENNIRGIFLEQGLDFVEPVNSLPPAGEFVGQQVFLRTDGKLYHWTGSSWSPVVANIPDESITITQIADDSISTPKLRANAVTANEIDSGTITTSELNTDQIKSGLIQTAGIIANSAMFEDGVIENAKIKNLAVERAKIDNNAANEVINFDYQDYSVPTGTTAWNLFQDSFGTYNDPNTGAFYMVPFVLDHDGNAGTVADVIVVCSIDTAGRSTGDEVLYRGVQIGPDNSDLTGHYDEEEWRTDGALVLAGRTLIASHSFDNTFNGTTLRAKMGATVRYMDAVPSSGHHGFNFKGFIWIRYR